MASDPYRRIDSSRHADLNQTEHSDGIDAKIVVLGNSGVGKTSLLHRYVKGNYEPANITATTSAFFAAKRVSLDNLKVRLQLWDTAGQERFRSMAPIYYRGANAALLLYDITNTQTFEDLHSWLLELKKNCSADLIIYIVGAKSDLYMQRQVSADRIRLTLHKWFPPPRSPTPPPPPEPVPHSYIRPRFTSLTNLTNSHSVSFFAPRSRTQSHSVSPHPSPDPIDKPFTPAPLRRSKTINTPESSGQPPLASRRSPRTSTPDIPGGYAHSKSSAEDVVSGTSPDFLQSSQPVAFPQTKRVIDRVEESDTEESVPHDWSVEEDVRLFEVSSKDDQGVKELFDQLIRAIIAKKQIIEREKMIRERDSVFLSNEVMTPSWQGEADEEEARLAQTTRRSLCCAF